MRIKLNTSMLVAGFRNPLPEGAVITAVDEIEAEQLHNMGYATKTDAKATHDQFSEKAEAEAAKVKPITTKDAGSKAEADDAGGKADDAGGKADDADKAGGKGGKGNNKG